MVMERAVAVMDRAGDFDHELDDVSQSMMPSSLRAIFLELDPNPPLPPGWEKCLDLQSGIIYFKDLNTGMSTYKDPRKKLPSALVNSPAELDLGWTGIKNTGVDSRNTSWSDFLANNGSGDPTNLELSLKLESGTAAWKKRDEESKSLGDVEESSVCTVEKVKDALKRSHFRALSRNDSGCTNSSLSSLHALSLNLPSPPSPSSKSCRPANSYASSTSSQSSSHSVMSFQGEELDDLKEEASSCSKACDDTRANEEEESGGVMVTLGCKRCLMYIMLSKANPCCPKCGSSNLLEILPTSIPKRQKVE